LALALHEPAKSSIVVKPTALLNTKPVQLTMTAIRHMRRTASASLHAQRQRRFWKLFIAATLTELRFARVARKFGIHQHRHFVAFVAPLLIQSFCARCFVDRVIERAR
jgi:hypothetical protein